MNLLSWLFENCVISFDWYAVTDYHYFYLLQSESTSHDSLGPSGNSQPEDRTTDKVISHFLSVCMCACAS